MAPNRGILNLLPFQEGKEGKRRRREKGK